MKVLIVDRREIVRLGLRMIASKIWVNSQISESEDLNSAIEKIAKINYDLLLINTHIGGKGELMNLIRLLLEETRVAILTDTSNTNGEEFLQLMNAGVDTIIPMKDTDLSKLEDVLKNLF